MAVRPVILYPDSRLKTLCLPVSVFDETLQIVLQDLLDTMEAGPPRTVGIAAPQIGAMMRVCLVDTSRNPKYPGGHGLLMLVNPVIVASSGTQVFREGCLSIPEYTADIHRFETITVKAVDGGNQPVHLTAEGFEAVVLQHEIDHLDGLLFLDRVSNVKTDLFKRKNR